MLEYLRSEKLEVCILTIFLFYYLQRDTVFIQFIERCEAEKKEVLEADMQLQEAEKRRKRESLSCKLKTRGP